jgi:hypothetical protein
MEPDMELLVFQAALEQRQEELVVVESVAPARLPVRAGVQRAVLILEDDNVVPPRVADARTTGPRLSLPTNSRSIQLPFRRLLIAWRRQRAPQ